MDWTGLAATTWDDFAGTEPHPDYYRFRRLIDENPGPVLDVGCGTGRLLIPYLASGMEIHGVDSSAEMLSICRDKASRMGLKPLLHRQLMQTLDVRAEYATIIVPGGSFHLVTDREEAMEALRRFHRHLGPDGMLALSLDDP